eukprot:gnl/Chilomastix_cuspidata/1426.p1 GENE.gnl/Chilomastix_cuspidata/1426~~gnl/Chilomastix_cuspidata/1426.p1  ORF type:complete len:417 (+),score=124.64 gnl/Chilomastix_cuspidata/1426:108-1253(+)
MRTLMPSVDISTPTGTLEDEKNSSPNWTSRFETSTYVNPLALPHEYQAAHHLSKISAENYLIPLTAASEQEEAERNSVAAPTSCRSLCAGPAEVHLFDAKASQQLLTRHVPRSFVESVMPLPRQAGHFHPSEDHSYFVRYAHRLKDCASFLCATPFRAEDKRECKKKHWNYTEECAFCLAMLNKNTAKWRNTAARVSTRSQKQCITKGQVRARRLMKHHAELSELLGDDVCDASEKLAAEPVQTGKALFAKFGPFVREKLSALVMADQKGVTKRKTLAPVHKCCAKTVFLDHSFFDLLAARHGNFGFSLQESFLVVLQYNRIAEFNFEMPRSAVNQIAAVLQTHRISKDKMPKNLINIQPSEKICSDVFLLLWSLCKPFNC